MANMSMDSSFNGDSKFAANFAINERKQSENDQKSVVYKSIFIFWPNRRGR